MQVLRLKLVTGAELLPEHAQLDSLNTLVLVFGPSDLNPQDTRLTQLREVFPKARFAGCSTAGEIHGSEVSDGDLSVAVLRFEHTQVSTVETAIGGSEFSRQAGRTLGSQLAKQDLAGVVVLSDGLNVNGSELVEGLYETLPEGIPVSGGMAGDGPDFVKTWTLGPEGLRTGAAVAIGFFGDRLNMRSGFEGGWRYFGPARRITRSNRNVLFELDSKPALEIYKNYLGEHASELPGSALRFPLLVHAKNGGPAVVRTVLSVDEEAQSMTFAGDIEQGAQAQLMQANLEELIDGAQDAAESLMRDLDCGTGDRLSLAISCVGRRLLLGERTDEETEAVLHSFPSGTEQVGFYSYGEISSRGEGHSELQNQTMTLTMLWES